jgi:enoyl-CoA hydratase
MRPDHAEILFEIVDDHVAIVTLNRPEKRNAVNAALANALDQAVKQVESDPAIRVAILASSLPDIFCAGADVAEIAAGRARGLSTPDGGFAGFHAARRIKPWIAAVRGAALGGGCELCLACDMIVAADDACFGLPEVKRGLFAAAAGAYRLPRALPRAIAMELIATGGNLPAARAHHFGMVNRLAPSGDVMAEAMRLAGEIASAAPLGVMESLKLARLAHEHGEDELRALSQAATDIVFASQDAREGAAASREKRAPRWSGR